LNQIQQFLQKKSEVFSTAADNQPAVDIHVLQGERPMANDNKSIGRFQLADIPPAPRGIPQIEVTFDIDANGILNVSAKDKATGKEQNIKIEASSGLSDEEIEKMKKEAEANEDLDKKAKETADKINGADGMIFQTEKQLKEFGEKLSDDKKSPIEASLVDLKAAHQSKDLDAIDSAMEKINTAWTAASEEMYKASEQKGTPPDGGAASAETNDDVTDVEFEEVKEEE
jgi:molecular chaperone DnaK